MIRFRLFAAALSCLAVCACAGTTSPISLAPSSRLPTASLTRGAQALDVLASDIGQADGDTRLYVTNFNNTISFPPASPEPVADTISVFDVAHAAAPIASVFVGAQHAQSSIAFDHLGKLYLSSWAMQSVSVFDIRHGNARLPSITGLANAGGVAIDRHGILYVSNGAQVAVFDTLHGNAALPPITLGQNGSLVALDQCGKLYVNAGFGQIMIFDTEHGDAPLPPISFATVVSGQLTSAPAILGLTVDAGGKLYAATSENSILVFDTRHGNKPLPAITGDGTFGPAGMAEDDRGRLYVGNSRFGLGNTVLVFDTKAGNKLVETISGDGMMGVNSVALQ